ncbi:MAG: ATP-dependent RecD-like DNA helicase [Defluviitaleaceae bacterium]|nr:ATP-dependent RecD-like DNA helicase [Defluviitaleaceae bacterium]
MEEFTQEEQILEGVVENVIFQNDAKDFAVFVVSRIEDETMQEITCTAQSEIHVGEDVKLTGFFFVHPNYGKQFKAHHVERIMPKTTESMEKYLASGAVKGIGPVRAANIVNEFGLDTFDILENRPEMLSKIKGITTKIALAIGEEFASKSFQRNTMMYLQNLGLTANQTKKIWDKYGDDSIDIVKRNPYVLAEDIFGIGFKIADGIAKKAGISHSSGYRISAGIKHVLSNALGEGHVYLPKEELVAHGRGLLELDETDIENQLVEMMMEGDIKQEKIQRDEAHDETVVYLAAYYHAEIYVARRLLELNAAVVKLDVDVESGIQEVENESGVTLADLQRTAVKEALTRGAMVITGGPGTGKTTTIKTIIRIMEKIDKKLVLCAPTGRAAKRMSEATGMPASTIHRLLGIYSPDNAKTLLREQPDEEAMIQEDCVIVDESSMVDIMLMFRLLRNIRPGTRLVLVGDVNQLPSVGAGNVLRDIINSGKMKTVYLDEIFRQSRQSAIVMNAHRINEGVYPVLNEKTSDFFFIGESDINKMISTISDLAAKRLPNFMGVDAIRDIQVLTPQRKSAAGVANLNVVLQNALNPASRAKAEKPMGSFVFRQGDKVMQIKNNYTTQWVVVNDMGAIVEDGCGVFNGDEGIIESIDDGVRKMRVRFDDDRLVDYEFGHLDELVLAYAITIHKSQGSEYDVVILPIHSGPPMLLNRNLLYTAITRAKKLVVIVGIANTLYRMVDNIRENVRYSTLEYRIVRLHRQWHDEDDE